MNIDGGDVWAFILFGIFGLAMLSECSMDDNRAQSRPQQTAVVQGYMAGEMFDLQAVAGLIPEARDGAHLEELINDPTSGINNLDLDENDEVDYVKMTEFGGSMARGFSLTTELGENQVQEIATITFQQTGGNARAEIQGNRRIYGDGYYYRSSFSMTDALILGWLFSSTRRDPYVSPYGYGSYPTSHYSRPPVSHREYRSATSSRTTGSRFTKSSSSQLSTRVSSPNSGRTATNVRAPLANPTATQREFQARNPSRQIARGGFGRNVGTANIRSNTSNFRGPPSSSASVRSSSGMRSGSSAGRGGK